MSDWRKQFLPGESEPVEEDESTETSELGDGLPDPFETPIITNDEAFDDAHIDDYPVTDAL